MTHIDKIVVRHEALFKGNRTYVSLTGGANNELYRVDDKVVKIYHSLRPSEESWEGEILTRLRGKVPVPELLLAEREPGSTGGYVIMHYIEGESLSTLWPNLDSSRKRSVMDELCAALRQLHAVEPASVKRFDPKGLQLDAQASRKHFAGDAQLHVELQSLLDHAIELLSQDTGVVVAHSDLHFSNILVERSSERPVLIDFEDLTSGSLVRETAGLVWSILELRNESGLAKKGYDDVLQYYQHFYPELFEKPKTLDVIRGLYVPRVYWLWERAAGRKEFGEAAKRLVKLLLTPGLLESILEVPS